MHRFRNSGRQDEVQVSRASILRILDEFLDEAAFRSIAPEQIADVLNIRFRGMLDPAKPDTP
jgi:hypothetical protein